MNLSSLTGKKYNYKYIKNIFAWNDDICCKSIIFNKITVSEITENFNFMWSYKFNSFSPVIILSYPNYLWHILQYLSYQDFCSGLGQTSNFLWAPWISCLRFHDHRQVKNKVKTKSQKGLVNTCHCKKSYTKKIEGDGDIWRREEQFDLYCPEGSHPPLKKPSPSLLVILPICKKVLTHLYSHKFLIGF